MPFEIQTGKAESAQLQVPQINVRVCEEISLVVGCCQQLHVHDAGADQPPDMFARTTAHGAASLPTAHGDRAALVEERQANCR